MEDIEKINNQRRYWIEKAYNQLGNILIHSLNGDHHLMQGEQDNLETTLMIITRFDKKLKKRKSDVTAKSDYTE